MNKKQLRKRRNEVLDIKICYCPVTFNEIPCPTSSFRRARFARNDKACVVYAVGRGLVGGNAANPAPTNSFSRPNSLSF